MSIRRKSIHDGTTISKKMKRTIDEGDSEVPTRRNHIGLALWWLITLVESSPQLVPARTPHGTLGPYGERPWVARSMPQRAR